MLICCWSSKGGSGTTVVATALALTLARVRAGGAVLCDLRGDVPAVLGVPDASPASGMAALLAGAVPPCGARSGATLADGVVGAGGIASDAAAGQAGPGGPGSRGAASPDLLTAWPLGADGLTAAALAAHEVAVGPGLSLVSRGCGLLDPAAAEALAALLDADPRPVVVDAGVLPAADAEPGDAGEVALALARSASRSLLVVRPCFLALRRALAVPVRASGVVLVVDEGRALVAADVEQALGTPVLAEVRVTPQVARAVDAGILAARLPRALERELRRVA